jgi:hypothetical protein
MHETPDAFNERPPRQRYPADNLAGFRYHTGATLRPLRPDEECPVLFRDLGPAATALFLRGRLQRLAGPQAPIIYMRDQDYVEPYTDHERIGRLILLRPLALQPWHSGVETIFVAKATQPIDPATVGFVPGHVPLAEAARVARELTDTTQLREVFGGRCYGEAVAETLHRLDELAADLARTEERAAPLRQALQSGDRALRERARVEMGRAGITEEDLCAAWHHLPRERRAAVREGLAALPWGVGG